MRFRHIRKTKLDSNIEVPEGIGPYPSKSDRILDKPVADRGGNFGRLARTGLMDAYIKKLDDVPLCGIKTIFWRDFFGMFQQNTTDDQARTALARLRQRIEGTWAEAQQLIGVGCSQAHFDAVVSGALTKFLGKG